MGSAGLDKVCAKRGIGACQEVKIPSPSTGSGQALSLHKTQGKGRGIRFFVDSVARSLSF
jgi:hypothetical protein